MSNALELSVTGVVVLLMFCHIYSLIFKQGQKACPKCKACRHD